MISCVVTRIEVVRDSGSMMFSFKTTDDDIVADAAHAHGL
jgi:hypothetical protein